MKIQKLIGLNIFIHFQIKYIHQGIPNGADPATFKTIGYIGIHPKQGHVADLVWRQGPVSLIEEPLVEDNIRFIFSLGPSYTGCFQAPSHNVCHLFQDEISKGFISIPIMILFLNLSLTIHFF